MNFGLQILKKFEYEKMKLILYSKNCHITMSRWYPMCRFMKSFIHLRKCQPKVTIINI